ncbi:MAG TPA: PilZ domain-containing protein [Candidatus Limnocylindrales bacterium]|nr:PilZ domain-containing protein [Candidatus Limnocylindrales bacterium]
MAVEFKERRRYPRYPCDTGVRVHPEKSNAGYWGTLSDISLGGCYVYTFSPLPVGQVVTLIIKANDAEISMAGKTVSSHPGVGMGIAFGAFAGTESEQQLNAYLAYLASQPRAKDSIAVFH